MSETYRHKADDSIRYTVTDLEDGRYEVQRADRVDIFGSEPFTVNAEDWETMYEPVAANAEEGK